MYFENPDYTSNLFLKNIFVQKSPPRTFKNNIEGRYSSAFMHIVRGEYRFSGNNGVILAAPGDTLYLPKNGYYRYDILTPDALIFLVNFDLVEQSGDTHKPIVFSDSPAVISNKKGETYKLFNDLLHYHSTDRLACISLLYQLIVMCKNVLMTAGAKSNATRIEPALHYMEENYMQPVSIDHLASLCKLSTTHFRRLFKEVVGTTPIKYKNLLLIKSACNLLVNDGFNVTETAYALNFDNIYTFSQAFKKEMGMSPKKYLRDHVKGNRA